MITATETGSELISADRAAPGRIWTDGNNEDRQQISRRSEAQGEPELTRALDTQEPSGLTAEQHANVSAHERTNAMEELHCKGTPAQVPRRVLAVLAEDLDLLWPEIVSVQEELSAPLAPGSPERDRRAAVSLNTFSLKTGP